MRQFLTVLALAMALGGVSAGLGSSQEVEPPKPAALEISTVHVEPANPAADTLCRLRVEIQNTGEQVATQLGFTVTINGHKLPVYENHLFMFPLEPGAKSNVPLYNFWSTETSRPEPANGKLEIDVTLREARWMNIAMEDETETWTPLGDVTGLPVSHAISVPMSKKTSG